MVRNMFILTVLISSLTSASQVLRPVPEQSSVKFKIKNFGFNVTGSFTGLQGTINFNPENPATSVLDVTIQATSVNTGIDMRDNHLRKEEYLNVKKYPVIRFVSVRISPSSRSGTLFMLGKLTIKNVTREISFPFTAAPQQAGYLFTGEFRINRIDFGVGESSGVADNLTVMLKVFARKS